MENGKIHLPQAILYVGVFFSGHLYWVTYWTPCSRRRASLLSGQVPVPAFRGPSVNLNNDSQ